MVEKQEISEIFETNKARYGYRRILAVLRQKGYIINHKTVLKLMKSLNLQAKQRKSKYKSYKGEVRKVAENLLKRNFTAEKPFEKLTMDVTEFSVCNEKVYLSPIMDLYNREIISYSISKSPNFWQTREMLQGLFEKLPNGFEHINGHNNKIRIKAAIDNLAKDIKLAYPSSTGYSVRNLKYMAKFAATYDEQFVQQAVAQIPWGPNVVLLDKITDTSIRKWYIEKIIENGWSRNVLVHQIESGLYERQAIAQKVANFESLLPAPQSELAMQTMKDPYVFDFIPFKEDMVERDIENALVKDVTALLLELGTGFAFLGNQYHLNVGGDDFYIDLLFYNLNLRCYVVIELKTGEFKPEYAGQLNFYLSAVDGQLKKENDNPTIGLLLCKSKNNLVAEYSLKDMSKPMGISEYKVSSILPKELSSQLPSVEDIQKRIK